MIIVSRVRIKQLNSYTQSARTNRNNCLAYIIAENGLKSRHND